MDEYNKLLFRIYQDVSVPIYNRKFAALFSVFITISLNPENDKMVAVFSDVCDTIVITYLHLLLQIIDNTIDFEKSRLDYDELNEYVNSIHREIKTNESPERTRDRIEKQLSTFC